MTKRPSESNPVIVACCSDLPTSEKLKEKLSAADISFTVSDESVIDHDPKTGYPRAFDIFWVQVEESQTAAASEVLQAKHMPSSGKLICPKCLSSSVKLEGFGRWFLPAFLTRCLNGHPNLPGRQRQCLECNYAWAPFNRPSL